MGREKIVPGSARKVEDIRKIYEVAMEKVATKGRMTEQGRAFTGYINEVFDGIGIQEIPLQVAAEYIREASGNYEDRKALVNSLQSFLKTGAGKANFSTYRAEDGRKYIAKKEA